MRIDDLRTIKNQRPFVPFHLVPAGGEPIPINHPDAISWDRDNPRLIVVMANRQIYRLDPMLVVATIEDVPPPTADESTSA